MRTIGTTLAAALLAFCTAAPAAAQMTVGAKLGASFSTVSSDPETEDAKMLTAFTGGAFLRIGMGGFSVQPELMYVTKGLKFEDETEDAEFSLELSYLEVPVLFVLPLATGARFAPYVYAGPAFALEIGCQVAVEAGGISGSVDCDDEAAEGEFERGKFDIGAMVGAGVGLPAGPGSLLVEARYNFGLMNLAETDGDESFRHRSGAVLIGYSIPLDISRR
jgi:hypothetical protein